MVFGIWDMGYGIWDMGFKGKNLMVKTFICQDDASKSAHADASTFALRAAVDWSADKPAYAIASVDKPAYAIDSVDKPSYAIATAGKFT